jgi:hypothetical protein
MKFISSSDNIENVDKKDTFEIYINKLGRPVQEESEQIFAQTSTTGSQSKYAILILNNQPYDPYGIDSHRESKLNLKLKQVSLSTYNYYVSYLKTKNSLYMTRAQRSFING